MAEGTGGSFEYPDEAGYPDGTGTLSETQRTLIDEVNTGDPLAPGIEFFVVENDARDTYEAVSGTPSSGESPSNGTGMWSR